VAGLGPDFGLGDGLVIDVERRRAVRFAVVTGRFLLKLNAEDVLAGGQRGVAVAGPGAATGSSDAASVEAIAR
jgi:hypothetical protein